MQTVSELFGEPISTYTDEDALDDGLLVDVRGLGLGFIHGTPINRVTRAVFDAYTGVMGATKLTGVVTNVTDLIRTVGATLGGAKADGDWMVGTTHDGRELWFVPNEVNGYTVMFPEDY